MSNLQHLELAREKLNPNNLDSGLPGRDSQIETIYNFLFQRLRVKTTQGAKKAKIDAGQVANIRGKHENKTIFICGVPGTGKTASVNLVLDKLKKLTKSKKSQASEQINSFIVINVNAQALTAPDRVYSEIYYQLFKKTCSPLVAQEKLELIFRPTEDSLKRRESQNLKTLITPHKIIVVDELDLLYSDRREDVFYNLFDWPTSSKSKVILIAIANAMDLPERVQSKIASRLGWEKLVFEPYKSDSLEQILKVRLGQDLLAKCFDRTAISVATKRIGRTTGDARRILDVCRLAIGCAIRRNLPRVDAKTVDEVGFEKLDLQRTEYLQTCGPYHLTALKALLMATINNGEENVDMMLIMVQFYKILEKHPILESTDVDTEEFHQVLNDLAAVGLIYLEHEKPLFKKRIYLKDPSDVTKAIIKKQPIIDPELMKRLLADK